MHRAHNTLKKRNTIDNTVSERIVNAVEEAGKDDEMKEEEIEVPEVEKEGEEKGEVVLFKMK
ncbi:hypothetical protein DFQ27_000484, partial [Actinomortierella ambigua]